MFRKINVFDKLKKISFKGHQNLISALILLIFIVIIFIPSIFCKASFYSVDLRYVQTPLKYFLFKNSNQAFFPLWTNSIGCGYPIHAYGEGGLLYPLNWLIYPFFSLPFAHDLTIMVHLFICGIGMLFFCKNCLSGLSSLISVVVFIFSGWMCTSWGHLNSIQVFSWLPWVLYLVDRERNKSSVVNIFSLGIVISLMFYAGRPQITFYVFLMFLFYTFIITIKTKNIRFLYTMGLGVVVGIILAFPQILPTMEFSQLSDRNAGLQFESQLVGTITWDQIFWLFLPLWNNDQTFDVASTGISYIGIISGLH